MAIVGPGGGGEKGEKGETGATGAKGEFNWRGKWEAVAYAIGDAVEEAGSAFVCVKAMTAGESVKPPEVIHWALLAAKGEKGTTGTTGEKGEKGEKGTTGSTGPEGPAGPGFALVWKAVEAINAKLEQVVTPQCAVSGGMVVLRGKCKVTAEIAAKGIIFTLPAEARPTTEREILLGDTIAGATQTINIKTNGEVELNTVLTAGKFVFLDGLTFST